MHDWLYDQQSLDWGFRVRCATALTHARAPCLRLIALGVRYHNIPDRKAWPPHQFALADMAFQAMILHAKNQVCAVVLFTPRHVFCPRKLFAVTNQ